MKIMVTGATGFVGSHIVDILVKNFTPSDLGLYGRNVHKINYSNWNGINLYQGDLTDIDTIHSAFSKFKPDVVIHAAALADDWAPLNILMEVNAQGTQNIIEAMVQSETAKFLIHISSSGVYPRKEGVYIDENFVYGPYGNYHKSKVEAEITVKKAIDNKSINATILRPPNVMGPRDLTHMARVCQVIKNRKFPLIKKGKARQTWVAAEDLAHTILLIINQQEKANGQIYNIKSFEISVKELYDQVALKLNITKAPRNYPYYLAYFVGFISEIIAKIRRKPTTFNRYRIIKFGKDRLFDDSKIRSELGYHPQFSAKDTIERTVNWLLEHEII